MATTSSDGTGGVALVQRNGVRPSRGQGDAYRARTRVHQLLPPRADRAGLHRQGERTGRQAAPVRRQRRRGADQDRRALCGGGRLGGGRRSGEAVRHELLSGAEGSAAAFAEAVGTAREETYRTPSRAATRGPPISAMAIRTGATDAKRRQQCQRCASNDPGFVSAEDLTLQLETLAVQFRYGVGRP